MQHAHAQPCERNASIVGPADPYPSVLVLNLGVTVPDGPAARHGYHWLYLPDSRSGMHRVGHYSNVDPRFLPEPHRGNARHASLYVETAYLCGERPTDDQVRATVAAVCAELQSLSLVDEVLVADTTWIDVAYTWTKAGSDWVARATAGCRAAGIEPAGRYGRWTFQGIAASLREGMATGAFLRAE